MNNLDIILENGEVDLDICSYVNYIIHEEYEHSYIDDENSLPNDISFGKEKGIKDYKLNGGQLLSIISKYLQDDNICDFNVKENVINIELFNPMNGTGSTIKMTIKFEGNDNEIHN